LSEGAIIGRDHGGRARTAVDNRDLAKIVTCAKKLLLAGSDPFMVFNFHFALTLGDKVEEGSSITLAYDLVIRALDEWCNASD
jgi:hypothetical protein